MLVTILSYIAVWFLGATCLAIALCTLITIDKKRRAAEAARIKALLDSTPYPAPKPGPILNYDKE
jgi:hypothetical protein